MNGRWKVAGETPALREIKNCPERSGLGALRDYRRDACSTLLRIAPGARDAADGYGEASLPLEIKTDALSSFSGGNKKPCFFC